MIKQKCDAERGDRDWNNLYGTRRLSHKTIQPHAQHQIAGKRMCSCNDGKRQYNVVLHAISAKLALAWSSRAKRHRVRINSAEQFEDISRALHRGCLR